MNQLELAEAVQVARRLTAQGKIRFAPAESETAFRLDRKTYQRNWMRQWRLKRKAKS